MTTRTSTTPRVGDWGVTASGRKFWPLDPQPGDFDVEDIAHALSMQCRFAGHCREFYSVAQHAVLVSYFCNYADRWEGLRHDDSEAYLTDIPTPLKRSPEMSGYGDVEHRMTEAMAKQFGLRYPFPPSVKLADLAVLAAEKRDLMPNSGPWPMLEGTTPIPTIIVPLPPKQARQLYLERHDVIQRSMR